MNPIESETDRQVFLEVFGEDVIVDGTTIRGIFDYAYAETLDVSAREPMVMVSSADVVGVSHGTPVVVPSISFSGTVKVVEPDGVGMTTLMLRNT